MGFLKNIGKAIKKNVSLKNVIKIATPLMGAIPIVGGGLQNMTENIVAAKEAKKAQDRYNAEQLAEQAKQTASAMAGVVAQASAQNLGDAVYNGAMQGISTSTQKATGQAGATVVDLTIKEWFKQHWLAFVGGLGALFFAIWMITKSNGNKPRRKRTY